MANLFSESIYGQRMYEYYPEVISCIKEFQAILDGEYPEFESLHSTKEDVLNNAYLYTMDKDRILAWEKVLKIVPLSDSTIEDRREVIIARIRGQGKLNTTVINSIVNTFTGGTAISWVADSTLYVEITPPPNNKQYKFENIENELKNKVPAHLGLVVTRNYFTWDEVNNGARTWGDVKDDFGTWESVYLFVASAYRRVSK